MHSLHLSIIDMSQLLGTYPRALKTHNALVAVLFKCQTLTNMKERLQSITKVVIFIGSLIKVCSSNTAQCIVKQELCFTIDIHVHVLPLVMVN